MNFAHVDSLPRRAISLPAIPTYALRYIDSDDELFNVQAVKAAANELQVSVAKSRSMGEFLHSPVNDITKEQKYTADVGTVTQTHPDPVKAAANELQVSVAKSRSMGEFLHSPVNDITKEQKYTADVGAVTQTHPDPIKTVAAQELPAVAFKAVRSSCIATTLPAAQGRVPAANVLNFRWKFVLLGDGMYRRIPSAPAVYYRRKRKRSAFQFSKIWESFLEWTSASKMLIIIPEFSVFLLSTFILYIFFDIPYVNFPEYAVDIHNVTEAEASYLYAVDIHNVTEAEASYLVSGIGLTNMISMLFCGFIADWSHTRQVKWQIFDVLVT
ncbi:unnamed protein product [Gongylonema pulchrum]|uniref:Ion_trans domain-containing protein n=1 Tax=Gongylonema pulchrum TaxID=637853 RepID=A0A183EEV5_9BILA|nr:unnamed protein product [Gongylonema pulchrum]